METYNAKVTATVELDVKIKEYDNGEKEIVEINEVVEIEEFDNVRPRD